MNLMSMTFVWMALFVLMVVVELATMGLTTIWFAGGSVVALFASMAGAGTVMQFVLFIFVSLILLILIRPWAKKHFNIDRIRTNAQSLIDETGMVIEDIDNLQLRGRVSVNGQEWAARSVDEYGKIAKNTPVKIRKISGVKLIVEKIEAPAGAPEGESSGEE